MNSFSYLEPVCCSMSSSNCCFLTCIQISQEADQVIWYSHLLKNFPQLIVIHTVKGFGIVNKAEIDVFLELSCFFYDSADVGNLISGSSAFSKTSLKHQGKYNGNPLHLTADLSTETLQARGNGRIYLKNRKGKIYNKDYCTWQGSHSKLMEK